MSKAKPKVIAYLKTYCGWCEEVRRVLSEHGLEYEEKDLVKNPAFGWELEQKSGAQLVPTVDIDGTLLVTISGDELAEWLSEHGHPPSGAELKQETT